MYFHYKNIPVELQKLDQWVVYRKTKGENGKVNKLMLDPRTLRFAKVNDSSTWSSYQYALTTFFSNHAYLDGLAFVLTKDIIFIDIDHAIDDKGMINCIGTKFLNTFDDAYVERSCSGKGIHILGFGNLDPNVRKRNEELGLEIYESKRFVCLTGDLLIKNKNLTNINQKVQQVVSKYYGYYQMSNTVVNNNQQLSLSDEELISKINNSRAGPDFNNLMNGNIALNRSHSEADFALCKILAFFSSDPKQIDHIFRSSNLYRDKWDSRRGDSTYGEMTILRALAMQNKNYNMLHFNRQSKFRL